MPTPKPLPSLELLNEVFYVDQTSPSGLRWRKTQAPTRIKPGAVAGYLKKDGYWTVSLRINKKKKLFPSHRIVFFMHTGICPDEHYVDHIVPGSNSPENLRLANPGQNMMNRQKNKTYAKRKTSSSYKGVSWSKRKNLWHVALQVSYENIFVGLFKDEIEAAKAYNQAAIVHYGKFANLNEV